MTESNSVECVPKSIVRYIKENPHMAVSVALFCGGGLALQRDVTSLAGSLFGAGGALLGAWITELNKRRSEAEEKEKKKLVPLQHLRQNYNIPLNEFSIFWIDQQLILVVNPLLRAWKLTTSRRISDLISRPSIRARPKCVICLIRKSLPLSVTMIR